MTATAGGKVPKNTGGNDSGKRKTGRMARLYPVPKDQPGQALINQENRNGALRTTVPRTKVITDPFTLGNDQLISGVASTQAGALPRISHLVYSLPVCTSHQSAPLGRSYASPFYIFGVS